MKKREGYNDEEDSLNDNNKKRIRSTKDEVLLSELKKDGICYHFFLNELVNNEGKKMMNKLSNLIILACLDEKELACCRVGFFGNIELSADIITVWERMKEKIQQKIKIHFNLEIDEEVSSLPSVASLLSTLVIVKSLAL